MIKLFETGAFLQNGKLVPANECGLSKEEGKKNTMAYDILQSHNTSGNPEKLKIKFDKITSHDITFVGIIQTARASGLEKFPLPYVLTNCHNSLCAVGGTINEDDHMFGLTCAKKYGGVYVPPHQAVIHQHEAELLADDVGHQQQGAAQECGRHQAFAEQRNSSAQNITRQHKQQQKAQLDHKRPHRAVIG